MALDEIQAKFGGKWETVRTENMEKCMKARGFSDETAKSAATGKAVEEFEVQDDKIRNSYKQNDYMRENIFQLEEPFYFQSNTTKYKAIVSNKDGKLEMDAHPIDSDVPPYRVVREIIKGEMVQTMYVCDIVAKRVFKHL